MIDSLTPRQRSEQISRIHGRDIAPDWLYEKSFMGLVFVTAYTLQVYLTSQILYFYATRQ